jgi:hypothetical protein
LHRGFNPWDRICDPAPLRALFASAGIDAVDVEAESNYHPIPSPEAWWAAVMGSGYRGTVDKLEPEAAARVRAHNDKFIRESGIREVEANVVYAVAKRA